MGTANNENIYYIEAIGDASTRIGRQMIEPNMPPVEFPEALYKANHRHIKHYEEKGTISVTAPGTRDAVLKADAIRREKERMTEVMGKGDSEEPDPVLRARGFSVPEAYAEKRLSSNTRNMPTWTAPAATNTVAPPASYKCIAVTVTTKKQCMRDAIDTLIVCNVHKRMLDKGRTIKDSQDRIIGKDGKGFEGQAEE